MPTAQITGPGVEDMRKLAVKIRQADAKLRRNLRKQLGDAARPVADDVRQSILTMPVHPERRERGAHAAEPHHLRAEVAATVSSQVRMSRTGVQVSIVSSGRKMPEGKTEMPKHLDSSRGWGHPVWPSGPRFTLGRSVAKRYRHRPVVLRPMVKRGAWTWVRQMGKPQWFEDPVLAAEPRLRAACEQALEETKRELEH